jgi:hypothetical protein
MVIRAPCEWALCNGDKCESVAGAAINPSPAQFSGQAMGNTEIVDSPKKDFCAEVMAPCYQCVHESSHWASLASHK